MIDIYKITETFIWNKFKKNGFQHFCFEKENIIIDYWDNLKGSEALILVHGFGAQAEFQWYKQIKDLSVNRRVIIVNLLYFGNTKPLKKERFELEDQVNLIKILVEHLQLNKFDLIGVSYGGLVAIEYCKMVDNNINRLILVDAPIKYFTTKDLETLCENYLLNSVEELFAPKDYKGLMKQFKAAYYKKQPIPSFVYKILYQKLCLPNIENWESLIATLKDKLTHFSTQDYTFECPSLLIWGEYDDIIPVRISNQLQSHLRNSKVAIIKKTKHLPNLEKPKEFNKVVLNFLNQNN